MREICDVTLKNSLMITVSIHINTGPGKPGVFSGSVHMGLDSDGSDSSYCHYRSPEQRATVAQSSYHGVEK